MARFWQRFSGAVRRTLPGCITQSQAVAFNMFLAVFPMLLLVVGVAETSTRLRGGFLAMTGHLGPVLPPGVRQLLAELLSRRSAGAWEWISLGLTGTLLAGTQMMRLIIEGCQMVHGARRRPGFWSRNVRALLLLSATIAPSLLTASLIVFGKQMRDWMILRSGMPILVRGLWSGVYIAAALIMAMLVLAVVYRVGQAGTGSWHAVVPGATVATLLWWPVSSAFGLYVRNVPYRAVYGGLAVAIGLMLWMQLTATIILMGAAYNAEVAAPGAGCSGQALPAGGSEEAVEAVPSARVT
jgi:membrane protein